MSEGSYYVMTHKLSVSPSVSSSVRPSVSPLANSCEHNSSCSFQWMVLKPSRIVTHGTWLCVKDLFIRLFLTELWPFSNIYLYLPKCSGFPNGRTTFPSGVQCSSRRCSCYSICYVCVLYTSSFNVTQQ